MTVRALAKALNTSSNSSPPPVKRTPAPSPQKSGSTKKRKPGPVPGSKRTNRNERLADRLIDGTVAGLRAKAAPLELYEYLAALAGVQNV